MTQRSSSVLSRRKIFHRHYEISKQFFRDKFIVITISISTFITAIIEDFRLGFILSAWIGLLFLVMGPTCYFEITVAAIIVTKNNSCKRQVTVIFI